VTWDAGSEVGRLAELEGMGGDGRKDRPGKGLLFKRRANLAKPQVVDKCGRQGIDLMAADPWPPI
jgi:hypothetical protein